MGLIKQTLRGYLETLECSIRQQNTDTLRNPLYCVVQSFRLILATDLDDELPVSMEKHMKQLQLLRPEDRKNYLRHNFVTYVPDWTSIDKLPLLKESLFNAFCDTLIVAFADMMLQVDHISDTTDNDE